MIKMVCLVIILITNVSLATSQTISQIRVGDTTITNNKEEFAFLQPSTDTTNLKYIETLRITYQPKKWKPVPVSQLFNDLIKRAKEHNANSFRLHNYVIDAGKKIMIMDIHTYYAPDSIILLNKSNRTQNGIYVFGGEKDDSTKSREILINDTAYEIRGQHYKYIPLKAGQQVKLSKGGLIGTTITLKGRPNRPADFFSLQGFTFVNSQVYQPGLSVGFSAGVINYVDENLGFLLLQIYRPD